MKKKTAFTGIREEDEKAERKLHSFLRLWNDYIRRQIGLHKQIDKGRQSLGRNVKETIKVTEAFVKSLKKLK